MTPDGGPATIIAMSGARGTILIVEDDDDSSALLSEMVAQEGFNSQPCGTGADAVAEFQARRPTAVFCDWVLPDLPGIEVCRKIRAIDPVIPIIFISGRDDEASAVRGLDAGADEYLTKPVSRAILIARLEALLRKTAAIAAATQSASVAQPGREVRKYHFGDVEVNSAAREALAGGAKVPLGPLEYSLLEYLCRNSGIAISREQVLSEVYGYDSDISTDRVDLLVRRLRSKLGPGARLGDQLVAVPGYGYRLEPATA